MKGKDSDTIEIVGYCLKSLFNVIRMDTQNLDETQKSTLKVLSKCNDEDFVFKQYVSLKNKALKNIVENFFEETQYNLEMYTQFITCLSEAKAKLETPKQKTNHQQVFSYALKIYSDYSSETISRENKIKKMLITNTEIESINEENIEEIRIEKNPNAGKQKGYVVYDNSDKILFYIKTFTKEQNALDPCEALIYKIMEYSGLGPKTFFLVASGSSEGGSISAGNYIVTEAVIDTKEKEEEEEEEFLESDLIFALDVDKYQELFNQLFNTLESIGEIQSAVAMKDILSLYDTFNFNPKNYGVFYDKLNDIMKIQFVDHLPNANNGALSNMLEIYSPRTYLAKEAIDRKKSISPLVDIASKSKDIFTKDDLSDYLINKLFVTNGEKGTVNLVESIDSSTRYVKELIKAYAPNFVEKALEKLNEYVMKILTNLETFFQLMDYQETDYINDFIDASQNLFDKIQEEQQELQGVNQEV